MEGKMGEEGLFFLSVFLQCTYLLCTLSFVLCIVIKGGSTTVSMGISKVLDLSSILSRPAKIIT